MSVVTSRTTLQNPLSLTHLGMYHSVKMVAIVKGMSFLKNKHLLTEFFPSVDACSLQTELARLRSTVKI